MVSRFPNGLILGLAAVFVVSPMAEGLPSDDILPEEAVPIAEIDQIVLETVQAFDTPGLAIGIVKDGHQIYVKGYGELEAGSGKAVTSDTVFSIASLTKAFTATGLALLVDEGKIAWDARVVDYVPNFRMYDPWVTSEFRIRDLLIHNSGLGLGAGDLMFWPNQSFSRAEIVANLRHLRPETGFRTSYAYDNLLYIVAGEVIANVSGMSYEVFIEERLIKPLAMAGCSTQRSRFEASDKVAVPHVRTGDQPMTVDMATYFEPVATAASGGIMCSVESFGRWHMFLLGQGALPGGRSLLSGDAVSEMFTPQTIVPVSENDRDFFGTEFSSYGLGWFLKNVGRYKVAIHSGSVEGMVSLNALVPELNLGIVVFTNQQVGLDAMSVLYAILDRYLGRAERDWPAVLRGRYAQNGEDDGQGQTLECERPGAVEGANYIGIYTDAWFGDVTIAGGSEGLTFRSQRSDRLKGDLSICRRDLLIVRWADKTLNADAYLKFTFDYDGQVTGFQMQAISHKTDFSFDFQDLDFGRVGLTESNENNRLHDEN